MIIKTLVKNLLVPKKDSTVVEERKGYSVSKLITYCLNL